MNPTAGSFIVNPRLQRHFWLLAVGLPDNSSLSTIYLSLMIQSVTLAGRSETINILKKTIQLYFTIQLEIIPFHFRLLQNMVAPTLTEWRI
jgi:dynein heavy chain